MDAIELNMSKILDDIKWGQTPPKMGANAPFSDLDKLPIERRRSSWLHNNDRYLKCTASDGAGARQHWERHDQMLANNMTLCEGPVSRVVCARSRGGRDKNLARWCVFYGRLLALGEEEHIHVMKLEKREGTTHKREGVHHCLCAKRARPRFVSTKHLTDATSVQRQEEWQTMPNLWPPCSTSGALCIRVTS